MFKPSIALFFGSNACTDCCMPLLNPTSFSTFSADPHFPFSEANDLCNLQSHLPIDFHVHLTVVIFFLAIFHHAHCFRHICKTHFKPSYISFTLFNVRFKRPFSTVNTFTCSCNTCFSSHHFWPFSMVAFSNQISFPLIHL